MPDDLKSGTVGRLLVMAGRMRPANTARTRSSAAVKAITDTQRAISRLCLSDPTACRFALAPRAVQKHLACG
jgi:hypothetical protein